ncbi:Flp pilus assembly protein TadD [Kineosphaera limosa]|uniref:Uncharacterized protein n=1 Tax=Kineosphaera limosa NBRC 100340 TaxID=1184609 RepID=K6WKA5_9MICO|nr:hypothetical protein [Kineosphaera limosa]NYE02795.1 Flp pilus assembly protein TadD [Kineosphaera limosa]GAB94226.1 hypothetical protein KILIM_004_00150 [Kineosphaera limosa NBRC 100340]
MTTGAAGGAEPRDTSSDLDGRLRAWFGVDHKITDAELDALHDDLLRYLEHAPQPLRAWALEQQRTAKVAHAALTADGAAADAIPLALRDLGDIGEPPPVQYQPAPRKSNTPVTVMALVVIVLGVLFGVYQLGDRASTAEQEAAATGMNQNMGSRGGQGMAAGMGMGQTPIPIDPKAIQALAAKVAADAKDTDAMRELANMYVQAADYSQAAHWQTAVLQVTPNDTDARLALGASLFNQGNMAAAEKEWREVLRIDPKVAEAHYDLGFLYLSKTPADVKAAEAEWTKVAELAPGSQIAKTATAHLERMARMPANHPPVSGATSPAATPSTVPEPSTTK